MRRRGLLYATDVVKEFTVTSEATSISPLTAFASNLDLFPEAPAENETLFIEMACTKEDYTEYAGINDAPARYILGIYHANKGVQEEPSIYTLISYGDPEVKVTNTSNSWDTTNDKARPFALRKGFIEGLTYKVRYWYVPFITGSHNLLGGN